MPNLVNWYPTEWVRNDAAKRLLMTVGLFLFVGNTIAEADTPASDWSHWRGPQGNGITDARNVPTKWSLTENIRWQTALSGPSSATPTISGKVLFTTSLIESEYQLNAYSTTNGSQLWKRTVSPSLRTLKKGGAKHSAPSLVSDEERVVVITDQGECTCYRPNGEPWWKIDLAELLTPLEQESSYSSTPFLHEGQVYFQWIHGDGDPTTHESMVGCLDGTSGELLWKTSRFTGARKACEDSFASPILINHANQAIMISHGADYAVANRLTDGHELWRIGGLNPMSNYRSASPFIASPVASEGILILPAAKNGVVVSLDLTGQLSSERNEINRRQSGLIGWGPQQWKSLRGKPRRLWRLSGGAPGTASPLLHEGLLYLCSESGELTCYDAKTSEIIYRKWLPRGYYHASPVLADGKIYFASYAGEVTVLAAGRDFEVLAINKMKGPIVASPIIHDETIYLRSYEMLTAIGFEQSEPVTELSASLP